MRERNTRVVAAEVEHSFFMWLLAGLVTATAVSGAMAAGIAFQILF